MDMICDLLVSKVVLSIPKILVWSECSMIILREMAWCCPQKDRRLIQDLTGTKYEGEKSFWNVEAFPFEGNVFKAAGSIFRLLSI